MLHLITNQTIDSYWACLIYRDKLSLCLTKHHAMKTYGGVEVRRHTFLPSPRDGGEWSPSRPGCFTPRHPSGKKLGDPQSRSGRNSDEKISCPCRKSNPGRPAHSLVSIMTVVMINGMVTEHYQECPGFNMLGHSVI
jgi:hypothetical protein